MALAVGCGAASTTTCRPASASGVASGRDGGLLIESERTPLPTWKRGDGSLSSYESACSRSDLTFDVMAPMCWAHLTVG